MTQLEPDSLLSTITTETTAATALIIESRKLRQIQILQLQQQHHQGIYNKLAVWYFTKHLL